MSPENKQRIIGVLVLLAFIALLIPFLFTSGLKKKQSLSDEIPINAEKRQLIAEQIQGIDNTTTNTSPTAPMSSEQQAASQEPTGLSQGQTEQPSVVPSESNQTEAVNTATNQNQLGQPVAVPTENTEVGYQEAINATSAETAMPTKSVVKKAAIKKVKRIKRAKALKEYWSVQVGSFSNQARVQKLVADLYKKGFRVYVQKITTAKGTLTRILVGRETSKAKALKIAKRLETSMKIKGQIVRKK